MDTIYQQQRRDVQTIFEQAMRKMHPHHLIRETLKIKGDTLTIKEKSWTLKTGQKVHVIATGKAAGSMSNAIEDLLGKHLASGVAIVPDENTNDIKKIKLLVGSHPVPDIKSIRATKQLVNYLKCLPSTDLLFYLISGGTSSLLCMPYETISLQALQTTGRTLLECGASIHEINVIRKRISKVKGGRLLNLLKGNELITLVISDVPGNELADIGSGPTIADISNPEEVLQIIKKYKLKKQLPREVLTILENTEKSESHPENYVQSVFLIGSVEQLAQIVSDIAGKMGFKTVMQKKPYQGEAREIGREMVQEAINSNSGSPTAFIFVGESTVTVKGSGKGGRNQELALAAAMSMDGKHYYTMLSAGTDGRDGLTDAAGAICNGSTINEARNKGMDAEKYLENNDSYSFFKKTGELLVTGPTDNNLMDIQIILIE